MANLMKEKALYRIMVLIGVCVLLYLFPMFHIVSVEERRAAQAQAAFDPVSFVEKFWSDELLAYTDKALDISFLVESLATDPDGTRQSYSHQVGLSSTHYFFVKGVGTVLNKDEFKLGLSINGDDEAVIIENGPVFGNTVRDGSGLLDVNSFPNSQKFNLISAELNKRVEVVLETLWSKVDVGDKLLFSGCVEIGSPSADLRPLRVVPVVAEKNE